MWSQRGGFTLPPEINNMIAGELSYPEYMRIESSFPIPLNSSLMQSLVQNTDRNVLRQLLMNDDDFLENCLFYNTILPQDILTDCLLNYVEKNNFIKVKFFIAIGANVNNTDDELPLLVAIRNGNREMFDLLIEYGADILIAGLPLIEAVEYNRESMVRFLLEHGADVHVDNDVAIRIAAEKGYRNITSMLIGAGAANLGEAMEIALRHRQWAVAELIVQHLPPDRPFLDDMW